jgi:ABC-type phosphate transport system substrate-binding protein
MMIIDLIRAKPLRKKQKTSHLCIFVPACQDALWGFRLVQGRLIVLTISCLLACAKFSFAQVAVIAHKAVPVDTLSQTQLFDFYSGEIKFWSNKVPMVVFDLKPAGETREAFYKLLGKTPSRMKSIWLKKLLMGEGDPPEALPSEEEVLKKVAATPGAIGFVSKARVTSDVRVIVIVEKK